MADYDLTQTGQEVQDILDGAAMQTDLTAETERAELAEQTLQGGIDAEETRAKAAEKQNADDIDVIESKIPAGASDQNQLADKEFVNNSIATATATYRGAYNLVNDLSLTVGATHEQIATALAGAISTADNNDYCFVQIPTADATPTQIASIERYKFNGTAWAYEYTLNNSGFTAAQWAALNSGITSGLVAKLLALPTNEALALTLAGKQDVLTFDSVPVDGSNNPVKSGGVYSAIGDEETRAKAAEKANADDIDDIEALIPATASDENQLADKQYVNDGIATASATYRGSFNEVNDLSLTTDATHEQIATALAGAISTADNNDYCFVQIPTSDAAPTQIASIERYKFNGTAWAYEYTLNNSGFTAAQWAALNSGITSGLVAKLSALPTNDALTLALAGKQDVLTFDNEPTSGSNNPVKSGGVYDAIDAEATTRAAAIAAIVALIPEAASALNQLADKAFVNSSISTATAVFKGTFNVVVDLELSYNATQEQIATMLASKIISADNNDYCFVQIPTSDAAPLQIARTDRYKFNGTAWAYEYTLNNSGFTTAQWAAINSGITSLLKDKLIDLPTATELTALLAAKQNQLTFDTTPTTGSTNPVTSGGIKSAIDAEKARAEAAEADRYTKSETYNKTEINGMVSTPHQNYVTVPTYASLPSSGQSTDTIYRVSSYDGANNQVDDTVYSEYAWDGTQYVFLRVNSQIEEVFDITVYNNNTKYADLSAALGVDGANIPATLRRGGMSVKFVQSSDNKYVQFRYISTSTAAGDFANIANWLPIESVRQISINNSIINTVVRELYIYKKDGSAVNETLNFGIGNIYVDGDKRAINIVSKDSENTETWILDADSDRGDDLTSSVIELKEKNSSGYGGYIVLSKNIYEFSQTIYTNYTFNNSVILHRNCNPIISSYFDNLESYEEIERLLNLLKVPLSVNNEINDQFIELYLEGDGVSASSIYKLMNTYIDLSRYRLAFNITDGNNNIICHYDNDGILNPSNKDARNNVLILEEKNDSGVSGFAVVDFNKITSQTYNEILNSDRLTTLSVNPIIKSYLEDKKIDNRVAEIESYKISIDNDLLESLFAELYIYKKDGTAIDTQATFGLGNIYVSGSRRAINLVIKEGSTVTWILDADSDRGEDLIGPVIELKEKNNSGYAGYVVMRGDIFSIAETIGENYSFNNDRILLKNNNPIIASVLEDTHPDPSQDEINKRKEINSRLISCVKSTVSDEIANAKNGTYVDANAQGFLPSNTAAQNVSAMNTLLSAGGTIIVEQPGNYLVNDSMLLHSNTTLLFAPGVIIKMATDMPYVFVNQAAFNFATSGYDENIKVVGYHLDTNGYTCSGGVYGLRGFLTFFHAKNIYISDVECYYYKAHWFFMHLCDWENVEICNVQAFGDKDALHIGRGKNIFIHNCAICAVDDTIALNAWDFVESNPETGNIENVRIDNIVELPHYFNTSSAYTNTLGFSIRMLNGCWLNWSSGMTVQHSTRVVYDGKLYRCTNLQGTTATSNTAPDVAPGSVNVDGILWRVETSPAVLGVCVKNVYVSNYTTHQHKLEGSFCLSNGINEVDHKSWVQGATWIPNENIHFKNIECLAETPTPFLIQEDIKDVVVTNSIFENAKFGKGLVYFKDVFGLSSSSFTTPDMELVNNMHILGNSGQYKLSAVNVSGRRDTINIYTTDEQYSQAVESTLKTSNTTVTEQDKVYVV